MILRVYYYIRKKWRMIVSRVLYAPAFKKAGKNILIQSPLRVDGIENISIGDDTIIGYKNWLAAGKETGNPLRELIIGKGCHIGNFNHIYATDRVVIEDYVLTADKVYISDNLHTYDMPDIPICRQPVRHKGSVLIGEGSWLGENVCVICANVGRHCIIGANSVVTKDIPDYSVALGAPAKVIKKYDFDKKEWINLK